MNELDAKHPLDFDAPRFSIKKPVVRSDAQGELSDAERVDRAMKAFARDMNSTTAAYLESCVHCGHCAQACHFYVTSQDARYTPIWKVEPFKQAWKREAGPFAWLTRTFDLKPAVTADELREWQELLYDSCTMCGRCSMVCPMGIDIAALVGLARHAMFEAGLVPHELWAVAERAEREGSPLGATPKVLKERIEWLEDEHEVEIPLDKPKAEVLMTLSSIGIMKYPSSLTALAKVMKHAGYDWTLRSDGYEATNFGMLSGNLAWQKALSLRLINAAIACEAKLLVLPECGHAYGALRWQGANLYGKPLPFEVLHISEFLARAMREGRLRTRRPTASLTYRPARDAERRRRQLVLRRRRRGRYPAPRRRASPAGVRDQDETGRGERCRKGGHQLRKLPSEL
jgi:Fe-S oxidoreductase